MQRCTGILEMSRMTHSYHVNFGQSSGFMRSYPADLAQHCSPGLLGPALIFGKEIQRDIVREDNKYEP